MASELLEVFFEALMAEPEATPTALEPDSRQLTHQPLTIHERSSKRSRTRRQVTVALKQSPGGNCDRHSVDTYS